MANHFVSRPTKPSFVIPAPEPVEVKDPIDQFKEHLNDIKISIIKADTAIKNIEKLIKGFDKTKHSSEKFKEVMVKFNEKLRLSLRKTNIDMMYMDTAINMLEDELGI